MSKEIGEFSLKSTSWTMGGTELSANFEGTATGFGEVVGTLSGSGEAGAEFGQASWIAAGVGATTWTLARAHEWRRLTGWAAAGAAALVLVFGTNLLVRELGIGRPDRGVILSEAVAVRSAPAEDDDLTLFEIHEGTRVRIDQRAGEWAEVVLDDGKVGWVPTGVMEEI